MKLDNADIIERLRTNLGLDAVTSKIVIVGFGVTGMSVACYLNRLGFDFEIADSRENPPGIDSAINNHLNLKVVAGPFSCSQFNGATHLIVSPGISLTEEAIANAINHGARIIGDIDLFACSTDSPVIAITGSNGKSTVTTLVGEMVKAAGKQVAVGGNLGVPALDLLCGKGGCSFPELYVLELSSFQLERTSLLNATVATVLNVTPDHFDRHDDIADYASQKKRAFRGVGVMVINVDDPIVSAMQEQGRDIVTFSIRQKADYWIKKLPNGEFLMHQEKPFLPLSDLPIEGRHNAANALAAMALGVAVGLDEVDMCKAFMTFKGLPHRMQKVAEINGITWVNDSKATNIGACIAALQGYDRKVILIAGGDTKGADMRELVPIVKEKTKTVILMGKDAGLIEKALNGCVPAYKVNDLQHAVNVVAAMAVVGDIALLSPACSSLDQYKNYEDRGNKFTQAVLALNFGKNAQPDSMQRVGL